MDNHGLRRNYERRINRVLDYIEKHLAEEISLEQLADLAAFSPFHFHRIFTAMVGEPLAAFVRRLRLERAANNLNHHPDKSITAIALDCGFSSSSVFARLFKDRFGISASQWRSQGRKNRQALSNNNQALSKNGKGFDEAMRYSPFEWMAHSNNRDKEDSMQVSIENIGPIRAAYARRFGSYDQSSKEAWELLCRWAGPRGLLGPQTMFIGISYDDPDITNPDRLRYDACISIDPQIKPEGEIGLMEIPACRAAKVHFEGKGEGIKQIYKELYGRWLPESGFVPDSVPCLEIYLKEPDTQNNFVMDIYIPVVPA